MVALGLTATSTRTQLAWLAKEPCARAFGLFARFARHIIHARAPQPALGEPTKHHKLEGELDASQEQGSKAKRSRQWQSARVNGEALDASIGFRARARGVGLQIRHVLLHQLPPN